MIKQNNALKFERDWIINYAVSSEIITFRILVPIDQFYGRTTGRPVTTLSSTFALENLYKNDLLLNGSCKPNNQQLTGINYNGINYVLAYESSVYFNDVINNQLMNTPIIAMIGPNITRLLGIDGLWGDICYIDYTNFASFFDANAFENICRRLLHTVVYGYIVGVENASNFDDCSIILNGPGETSVISNISINTTTDTPFDLLPRVNVNIPDYINKDTTKTCAITCDKNICISIEVNSGYIPIRKVVCLQNQPTNFDVSALHMPIGSTIDFDLYYNNVQLESVSIPVV